MSALRREAQLALMSRLDPGDPTLALRGSGDVAATYDKVVAKRWRRSALSNYSATDARNKIQRAWNLREPLTFSIPCGGYKSWRVSSSPHPNWAEVFFVSYLRRYIREVGFVYPFGVRAELTYVSGVMDLVSNHLPEWQSTYVSEMSALLTHHSDFDGQLSMVDIVDATEIKDVRNEVLSNYGRIRVEWEGELSDLQQSKLDSAERNYAPHVGERVADGHLQDRILESAVLCDALDSLEQRRSYNKFGPRIQLVFGRQPQPAIHIGTCETSTTHFWVAEGVLERVGDRLLPRMVGHGSLDRLDTGVRVELEGLDSIRARLGSWVPSNCEVI